MTAPGDDSKFDLERFVEAQEPVYERVCAELGRGKKSTHWMWFIFPQLAGLGSSPTAQYFALESLAEARAYVAHPVLGPRLVECAELVVETEGRSAFEVFGFPDDLKLRSSMTLFAEAAPDRSVFKEVLEKYFDGAADEQTLGLLGE